jgi:hypothetical protein
MALGARQGFDNAAAARYVRTMRPRRIIGWTVVALLAAAVLVAAGLLGLANRRPAAYRPVSLSPEDQDQVASRFVTHVANDFGNRAGSGESFDWTITAEQANYYLAALDAIAVLGGGAVQPSAELEKAGFAAPAVALDDGLLTLMVYSSRHDKVISLDVGFAFDAQGGLSVDIRHLRVGALPVPRWLVDEQARLVRQHLVKELEKAARPGQGLDDTPAAGLAKVLRALADALDGRCIRPELVWHVGARHRVLVDRITIAGGQATLHMVPVTAPAPPATTAPAPDAVSRASDGKRP